MKIFLKPTRDVLSMPFKPRVLLFGLFEMVNFSSKDYSEPLRTDTSSAFFFFSLSRFVFVFGTLVHLLPHPLIFTTSLLIHCLLKRFLLFGPPCSSYMPQPRVLGPTLDRHSIKCFLIESKRY